MTLSFHISHTYNFSTNVHSKGWYQLFFLIVHDWFIFLINRQHKALHSHQKMEIRFWVLSLILKCMDFCSKKRGCYTVETCPCLNFFLDVLLPSNSKYAHIFLVKTFYAVCTTGNKVGIYEICKWVYSVLIYILYSINNLYIWICTSDQWVTAAVV